jgi:hypothetical protein
MTLILIGLDFATGERESRSLSMSANTATRRSSGSILIAPNYDEKWRNFTSGKKSLADYANVQ